MANTFKVVTKSSVATSSGSPTTLYTVPHTGGSYSTATVSVVLALLIAYKHTSSIKVTVLISSDTNNDGASANADVNVIKDVHLDDGTSLELMSGQKYVLQATDAVKIYADNANLDVTLSFMEITT